MWSLSGFPTLRAGTCCPRASTPPQISIYLSTYIYINSTPPPFPIRRLRRFCCTWSLCGFSTSHTNTSCPRDHSPASRSIYLYLYLYLHDVPPFPTGRLKTSFCRVHPMCNLYSARWCLTPPPWPRTSSHLSICMYLYIYTDISPPFPIRPSRRYFYTWYPSLFPTLRAGSCCPS